MTNDKSHSNELAKLRMRKLRRNRKEQKLKNLRLNLTAEQAKLVKQYAESLQADLSKIKQILIDKANLN